MPRASRTAGKASSRADAGASAVKRKEGSKKPRSKGSVASSNSSSSLPSFRDDGPQQPEEHRDLVELEQRLTEEVDEEFFQDPRKFHTLHRVIDVLGMQIDNLQQPMNGNHDARQRDLQGNPAYRDLKEQQRVVEEAIEHLALRHCNDLNGSVVQVGRVARQFHDAVTQVRQLRKQVKEIQETLGSSSTNDQQDAKKNKNAPINPNRDGLSNTAGSNTKNNDSKAQVATSAATVAMSLRELWMKKLEAEAVLSLLGKLDRIRAAPRQFDTLLKQNKIGAAVITVAQALDTMFSSDVAQVQALHKIMEQLMIRKQKAEEVVWELLMDVVFLRTGNGPAEALAKVLLGLPPAQKASLVAGASGNAEVNTTVDGNTNTGNRKSLSVQTASLNPQDLDLGLPYGMINPFLSYQWRFAVESDLQVENSAALAAASNAFGAEHELQDFLAEDDELIQDSMMIPMSVMDADFDLEGEERRHLEEQIYGNESSANNLNKFDGTSSKVVGAGATSQDGASANGKNANGKTKKKQKPTYGDHVLALRVLVECLVRLRRMDDVERIVMDGMAKEVSALVQREQARTFVRVEGLSTGSSQYYKRGGGGRYAMLMRKAGATTDLRDFRKHLQSVVSAFGNVQIRLCHLTQIVRHRLMTEKTYTAAYENPSAALSMMLQLGKDVMERELKSFLDACLHESAEKEPEFNINALTNVSGQSRQIAAKTRSTKRHGVESGLFSLGIIDRKNEQQSAASTAEAWLTASTTSRRSTIQSLETPKFVAEVLFAKTTQNGTPQVRHALFFRKALAKWQQDVGSLRLQLAKISQEDTSIPSFGAQEEMPALEYLDIVIQKDLLLVLQEEAVNGTVQALERADAFDPVLDRNVYARADSNEPQDVDMCRACNALYHFTSPLFLALHRLPKGGDMYLPLVAVLEHVILTFISRVKQQVSKLCSDKTALQLLMETSLNQKTGETAAFGTVMERRKAFAQLVLAYADGDLLEAVGVSDGAVGDSRVPLLSPSASDTPNRSQQQAKIAAAIAGMDELDLVGGVEREEYNLSNELQYVKMYLEFAGMEHNNTIKICSDELLMKASCLAHSLLKLSSLLDSRLKVRSAVGAISTKTLTNTRALREAIKTIKANGLKMAKFCRADVLLQSITRLSKVCNSSTVVARDAVRIPSSVNDLGEYMTAASDNLREAAGNAVTAYTFSNLEQYIPLCLIQTVRVLAASKGIVTKAPLTMNGIEALDRSGSVLYRDLKGATSFDNSFWDIELAAVSFERSASFIAMMELEMAELEAYYQENRNDFSEQDFQLMFNMNGPRRKGDIGRYKMLVERLDRS